MGPLLRASAASAVILLTMASAGAQDLPPALAARFSQGVSDFKAGQLDAAEKAFRDVLRAGSERAFVHHNLGLVLRERGREDDALIEFRAATKLDPSFGPARLLAGTSLLSLGRSREARVEFEHAARLLPREPLAVLQLANACRRLDDRVCVTRAYQKASQLEPDNPEHAYHLGVAYLELSQWAHARLAKIAPDSARVQQALGREYVHQGKVDLAIGALQRAIDADPTLPDLHVMLARIHFEAGRFDDADREVARELALVPSSRDALELQAQIERARRK